MTLPLNHANEYRNLIATQLRGSQMTYICWQVGTPNSEREVQADTGFAARRAYAAQLNLSTTINVCSRRADHVDRWPLARSD